MLGGHIGVESTEGKGSVFSITIPWVENANKTATATINEELNVSSGNKLDILIVEDDEISFEHLKIILKEKAKNISRVKNGKDAIDFIKNNTDTQLVLMDIKLPVLNGAEATREIRKFNKKVIIIAQTAYALSGDREKAMEAGCNDYVSKPIDKEKLFELIDKYH